MTTTIITFPASAFWPADEDDELQEPRERRVRHEPLPARLAA
ncbi:hypothetical protein SEA_GARDENSTATE_62 [Microbacterium phage GardenState]|uniref:Uncharacterized protein n=2 Tax=Gardenstatevirus TaxID=3425012 RepID=A0A4Y6E903_9CAUD|nr:hypothetical protein SEA_IAMGROOT_61 [Microbacterium phage IAmGroot]QOI66974.1 hypothetical protein SEA_GARDENSTATE_62 [Microbacterium phage GardenState]